MPNRYGASNSTTELVQGRTFRASGEAIRGSQRIAGRNDSDGIVGNPSRSSSGLGRNVRHTPSTDGKARPPRRWRFTSAGASQHASLELQQ